MRVLSFFSFFVLISMLIVTTWASLHESVVVGAQKVFSEPWAVATLFDAYFGFFFFIAWVFYKEVQWGARVTWAIFILLFGNIAMAIYTLYAIWKLKKIVLTKNKTNTSESGGVKDLLSLKHEN